jgi:hypothetical protein
MYGERKRGEETYSGGFGVLFSVSFNTTKTHVAVYIVWMLLQQGHIQFLCFLAFVHV